jgi:dTMP kinase
MTPPLFIALEGLDGAGTTTQAARLISWLQGRGRSVLLTREPSDGPVGRLIREMLRGQHGDVDDTAMSLLFAADRRDHLAREIDPAVQRGQDVISDRYVMSSMAYQGRGTEEAWARHINSRARSADLTVFLEVSVDVCLGRMQARGQERELYERRETLLEVRSAYRREIQASSCAPELVVIDGELPVESVTSAIIAEIVRRYDL